MVYIQSLSMVSTHSRPKAAGLGITLVTYKGIVSTHSRPKAAGYLIQPSGVSETGFQHTAARRRLGSVRVMFSTTEGFNTQPPEGGWPDGKIQRRNRQRFNTQPPEGGWGRVWTNRDGRCSFNTQPPEGGWS